MFFYVFIIFILLGIELRDMEVCFALILVLATITWWR